MERLNESLMRDKSKQQFIDLKKEIDKVGGDIETKIEKDSKTPDSKLSNIMYSHNPFNDSAKIDTYEKYSKGESHKKTKAAKSNEIKPTKVKKFNEFGVKEGAEEPYSINFDSKTIKLNTEIYDIDEVISIFYEHDLYFTEYKYKNYHYFDFSTNKDDSDFEEAIKLVESNDKINENKYIPYFYRINKLKEYSKEDLPGDKGRPFFNNIPEDTTSYDILKAGKVITFGKVTGKVVNIKGDKIYLDIINSDNKHIVQSYLLKDVIKKLKKSDS